MTTARRVLVTGSRDWADPRAIDVALASLAEGGPIVVVHGACPGGVDAYAAAWARNHGVPAEPHPAQWALHGKRAGFIRNAEMVVTQPDACVAFVAPCRHHPGQAAHGSHGADHCASLAERAGIPTMRVTPAGSSYRVTYSWDLAD